MSAHIRVIDQRPDPRMAARVAGTSGGRSHNLCGADPTDRDITTRDARTKRMQPLLRSAEYCQACVLILQRAVSA